MSLYDGKTLEADYRQLVKDNLAKLERQVEIAKNKRRTANGYYQVINGSLRFVEVIKPKPIKRDANRRKDGLIRSSNRSAQAFASDRSRQYRLNASRENRPLPPKLRKTLNPN